MASFQGLPRRHARAGNSYLGECNRATRALRQRPGMMACGFPMTFQSRFGREGWLEPHTEMRVAALPWRGIRRLAVVMPGFLADCIETLDEIGHERRLAFWGQAARNSPPFPA